MTGGGGGEPAWWRHSLHLVLAATPSLGDLAPDRALAANRGRGARVAVIDSGIEADHPLLEGSVNAAGSIRFELGADGRPRGVPGPHPDGYGHGTACAGIIHAVAPEAEIVSVRVLDEQLQGRAALFHAGLVWAVEQGFDVINLSLGATQPEWALAFHDACDRAYFAGSFLVTAANNVQAVSFPSLFASVASVAASSTTDPFRFHYNPEPPTEFLARGLDVEVPWLGGTTMVVSGNSFAAPHIAGFAALIKAGQPELRPFQVKTALWAAAANVRAAAPAPGTAPPGPGSGSDPVAAELGALLSDYRIGPSLGRDPWGTRHAAAPAAAAPGPSGAGADPWPLVVRRVELAPTTASGTRARFLAAVELVASLDHPHLAPIEAVRAGERSVVLVGPHHRVTLAEAASPARHRADAALAAVLGVLRGLSAVHGAGLCHGDLRPDTVAIGPDGRAVLFDIGFAAALSSDVRTSTAPGDPASWSWLAPEQLEGAPVGPFTDVHAAGLLLFELLAGELPYPPVTGLGALVRQRATARPRSLAQLRPDLPSALAAAADRAVAADPADRPTTASELAAALTAAADAWLGPAWLTGR